MVIVYEMHMKMDYGNRGKTNYVFPPLPQPYCDIRALTNGRLHKIFDTIIVFPVLYSLDHIKSL